MAVSNITSAPFRIQPNRRSSRGADLRRAQDAVVRVARPGDIPALMRMKVELERLEGTDATICASKEDWRRDGFGVGARFSILVAEQRSTVIGMLTYNKRYLTGLSRPTIVIQDLFVYPTHRNQGIGGMLLAKVAAQARRRNAPMIELTVRADNPARRLYDRLGFQSVPQCVSYVVAGAALDDLSVDA
jgi:ribosomal protein S18 acetylase RimI-like enzyme